MTVSRAINNHPEINAETRERVLAVAKRLNYQPNQHARALATNRSYLFGVVVPDLMHSYFAELLHSIESIARPAGFQIVICNTEEDATREVGEVEALRYRTDGLIIASALSPADIKAYRKMIREGIKMVLIDRLLEDLRCPAVTTDNIEVGVIATEHLIELGHKQIGHLCGPNVKVGLDRFEGYQRALAKQKIKYDKALVRNCGFLEHEGYEAMRDWISEGNLPPAIFAANDPTAIGAMMAMDEAGIRPGIDIAVVGGGNIHYGDMLRVPLTTVSWSRTEMGQAAARILIQMINGELDGSKNPQHLIIEPKLLVRQSSGGKKNSGR